MGIPSYFSYIIKNHRRIVETLAQIQSKNAPFDSLYMDCNSIIYDIYYQCIADAKHKALLTHDYIIDRVIVAIEFYVRLIQPTSLVYIAFDGVAPFAKMEQQRTRRYKSWHQTTISDPYKNNNVDPNQFITAEITPGTRFMAALSKKVGAHFATAGRQYIVSGSDHPGEGEHKMFHHIRQNAGLLANKNVAVYGLDSDLIMLSIFHCFPKVSDATANANAIANANANINIYIFRESNEFVKSIPGLADTGTPYFLDIRQLAILILCEMTGKTAITDRHDISRIYDYVFLCFMLGNDFLPHFPAMNIRTHGIHVLLEMYKTHIGKYAIRGFIKDDTNQIRWRWFSHYVKELAKCEHEWLVQEIAVRDKMDGRFYPNVTAKDREQILLNTPTICRQKEKYIAVKEAGWQGRYYRTLFRPKTKTDTDTDTDTETDTDEYIKGVCVNYLEGLEWVFKYYTAECADWRWTYAHHYPPLLSDLQKYVPNDNNIAKNFTPFLILPSGAHLVGANELKDNGSVRICQDLRNAQRCITDGSKTPYTADEQLAYVLPPAYSHLLSSDTRHTMVEPDIHLEFEWAFCRYFWESHIVFP